MNGAHPRFQTGHHARILFARDRRIPRDFHRAFGGSPGTSSGSIIGAESTPKAGEYETRKLRTMSGQRKGPQRLSAATPLGDAASTTLAPALMRVGVLLKKAGSPPKSKSGSANAKTVHQLRVGCRRAAAVMSAFADLFPAERVQSIQKRLKSVRRAAGKRRDLDVIALALRAESDDLTAPAARGVDALLHRVRSRRSSADAKLFRVAARYSPDRWKEISDSALNKIDVSRVAENSLPQLARRVIRVAADEVLAAGREDLQDIERMHKLRLRLKRLRYRVELFAHLFPSHTDVECREQLETLQDALGAASDADRLCEECEAALDDATGDDLRDLTALRTELLKKRTRAQRAGAAAWGTFAESDALSRIDRALWLAADAVSPGPSIEPKPVRRSPSEPAPSVPDLVAPASNGHSGSSNGSAKLGRRRIAAIDVGTNSIRLIIAEATPEGSYRVLDDEKEITRLGRGLEATGRLDPAAIAHSVAAITRMQAIAQGYGASQIRAVATSAAREAANSADLLRDVRSRAGIELEVISAEQEALLAYRSASNAFDFTSRAVAVVDIGGGSTEVILSVGVSRPLDAARAGVGPGVIERLYTIPLGAVKLCERFGGPEKAASSQFRKMRDYVKSVVRQHIGKRGVPTVPQVVVGTGGTATTLAAMARLHALGAGADTPVEGSIQGFEVSRPEARHLLDYLRKLSGRDRARVPGLPADRADIIVPGLTIVDVLLKSLDCNRFLAHEGGIRDGLLWSMVQQQSLPQGRDLGLSPDPRASALIDPIRAVRRFARSCGYEQAHALHVTTLALSLFDQLALRVADLLTDSGVEPARARMLLQAAAILHDIGYLINYNAHHKHSLHLISHADLPGWTAAEVQIIANVARYHRAAEPKERHAPYAALSKPNRRVVRALAAILRVADGLDRSHMQAVKRVEVAVDGDAAMIRVFSPSEPEVDLWGAARKAGLFQSELGLTLHMEWSRTEARAGRPGRLEARTV